MIAPGKPLPPTLLTSHLASPVATRGRLGFVLRPQELTQPSHSSHTLVRTCQGTMMLSTVMPRCQTSLKLAPLATGLRCTGLRLARPSSRARSLSESLSGSLSGSLDFDCDEPMVEAAVPASHEAGADGAAGAMFSSLLDMLPGSPRTRGIVMLWLLVLLVSSNWVSRCSCACLQEGVLGLAQCRPSLQCYS